MSKLAWVIVFIWIVSAVMNAWHNPVTAVPAVAEATLVVVLMIKRPKH